MIICNIVITCSWRTFENKEEMKSWMTEEFVPDSGEDINKFREYNFAIARKHGEENFSMTFIKPNTVVLTQRYNTWDEYNGMLELRKHTLNMLKSEGFEVNISDPIEEQYV
jgi:hypothetical protein